MNFIVISLLLSSAALVVNGSEGLRSRRKLCQSCEAQQVNIGGTYHGSTFGQVDDGNTPRCSGGNYGGRWYKLPASGISANVRATTCGPGFADYDSYITVFSGYCDSMSCVTSSGGDPSCSTVSWDTVPGVEYYILVHGDGNSYGNYALHLTSFYDPNQNPAGQCVTMPSDCFWGDPNRRGCDTQWCQANICAQDPYCCNHAFDDICSGLANNLCPRC